VTTDTPIPDPALSATLVALQPRMEGLRRVQHAQEAEIAVLRARSERVLKQWYEGRVLGYAQFLADVEGQVEKAERVLRRAERARQAEEEGI